MRTDRAEQAEQRDYPPCPYCGAPRGYPCRDKRLNTMPIHRERFRLWTAER